MDTKFIKIYYEIAFNSNIKPGNKVLLSDLYNMNERGLFAKHWISNTRLAERYNITSANIKKMLEGLKKDHRLNTYIERDHNSRVVKRDIIFNFTINDKRYIELSEEVAFRRDIGYIAKLVYAYINSYIRLIGACVLTERYLGATFGHTIPPIRKALDELRKADLIYNETTVFGKEYKLNKKNIKKFK